MNSFSYFPIKNSLYETDVRCRLLCMSLICFSIFNTIPVLIIPMSLFFIFILKKIKINFYSLLKDLKFFFLILIAVFVSKAITAQGNVVFNFFNISITDSGLFTGGILCWKFLCVMLTGIFMIRTTKPSQIKTAVQWLLKPVPFVPHAEVAVMASLFFKFLPLIILSMKEVSQAQNARCFHLCRNPLKKIQYLVLPVLKKNFHHAENLINSMEARCYDPNRTDPRFSGSGKEKLYILICASVFIIILLFKYTYTSS